jgi:hypothetical protein
MEISHYDNLPSRYRMQHGRFDFNREETQMQLRYRTPFDICVEMNYIDDGFQYYHDRYSAWRKAALQFLDARTLQIDREEGRAIEELSDNEVRAADKYNRLIRLMDKRDCETLAMVCAHIPSGANIPQMKVRLHQLQGNICRAFDKLKLEVDSL